MNRSGTALSLLFVCLQTLLSAQSIVVTGSVRDAETKEAIMAATVSDPKLQHGTYTDSNGVYRFTLPEMPDTLRFAYIEYPVYFHVIPEGSKPVNNILEVNVFMKQQQWPPPLLLPNVPLFADFGYIGEQDRVNQREMQRHDPVSLEPSLNAIPGLRYDSRGPGGSRRLSMRGSLLRSPFGVRNIKMYIDGLPLTSPDGSTGLEVIDIYHLNEVQVHKGPMGNLCGAGNGGVVDFFSAFEPERGRFGGKVGFTTGSYGLLRTDAAAAIKSEREGISGSLRAGFVHQQYAGYRAQEANRKDQFNLNARYRTGDHRISTHFWYHQGRWELPGALDSAELAADPRQALAYSENSKAAVDRERIRLGVHHVYVGSNFHLRHGAYLNTTNKENPYGTSPFFNGIKDEKATGTGYRGKLGLRGNGERIYAFLGGEYQREGNDFLEFVNDEGARGPLKEDSRTVSSQGMVFGQLQWRPFELHLLTLGTSLNFLQYDHRDHFSVDSVDHSQRVSFRPQWMPSMEYRIYKNNFRNGFLLFFKAAMGYSPPSFWEVARADGSLNTALRPEQGINLEVRYRFRKRKPNLTAEVNLYHFWLRNAILPEVLSSGETVFENKGEALQRGLELYLEIEKPIGGGKLVGRFNSALQWYTFGDYEKAGADFRGKQLPGVSPLTMHAELDWKTRPGLRLVLNSWYYHKTPVDDANTVYQKSYILLNTKVLWEKEMGGRSEWDSKQKFQLTPFIGLNNVLNTPYSNFLQLNARNGRYWNPAPGFNWYAGLNFEF